eukprot:TRINITY_DN6498_c0_g1_i2.p1 TRINITY_DN6498_c0_g1~~TRINITY_DN6498_c0_g1_i2.p1  ORF type:complete len:325 (+),score=16.71 TRINITY_DN6498_c0_g1_i2:58-1032(+)
MEHITKEGLEQLHKYQYVGTDKSLLAYYVGQPWWRFCVEYLPLWMAPNLVTMIGFMFNISAFLLQAYYCPTITADNMPSWAFYIVALFQFIYQTMDAIDGKQARRTDQSSPLGELCDHGCDALSISLQTIQLACTLNFKPGWIVFWICYFGVVGFWFGQWEEYYTGRLDLGYFGVTEAQLLVIGITITSGYYGASFWQVSVPVFGYEFTIADLVIIASTCSIISLATQNLYAVYKESNARGESMVPTLSKLVPFLSLVALYNLWAYFSSIDIVHLYPYSMYCSFGFYFANLVGRMVLNRVCNQNFNIFQPIMIPILLGLSLIHI